jgi:metallophosphoesterase (TIGR00282 family)
MALFKILFVGDVVGTPGMNMVQKYVKQLRRDYKLDAVIINGENAADGRGLTPKNMTFFRHCGADMVTSGNHIWHKKDIYAYLNEQKDLLRPANFPTGCPGSGVGTFTVNDVTVGVINVQGRVFMREQLGCPFRAVESAITFLKTKTPIILVDFHAEASSEKTALATLFDGKVSAVVGTHTHVQTADERIMPHGTAFICDVGMCGALHSIIGMKSETILTNILTQMPSRFEVETRHPLILNGVIISIDRASGLAEKIERINIVDATE